MIAVVGGAAFSLTMMACYGGPPCETFGEDADGDGHVTAQGATGGCFELDCNDADPATHPGAEDAIGDGLDTNCDGADGVVTFCSVDEDCPADQPTCDVATATCQPAPSGEGEGEN